MLCLFQRSLPGQETGPCNPAPWHCQTHLTCPAAWPGNLHPHSPLCQSGEYNAVSAFTLPYTLIDSIECVLNQLFKSWGDYLYVTLCDQDPGVPGSPTALRVPPAGVPEDLEMETEEEDDLRTRGTSETFRSFWILKPDWLNGASLVFTTCSLWHSLNLINIHAALLQVWPAWKTSATPATWTQHCRRCPTGENCCHYGFFFSPSSPH